MKTIYLLPTYKTASLIELVVASEIAEQEVVGSESLVRVFFLRYLVTATTFSILIDCSKLTNQSIINREAV